MKGAVRVCMLLVVVLAVAPCYGGAPPAGFTLFDNFSGKMFDPNKWIGQAVEADTGNRVMRESIIEVDRNQAHLLVRSWACTTNCGNFDDGTKYGQNRLRAIGNVATALQATIQVKQVAVVGSDTNTAPTQARIRLMGWFFNDGSGDSATFDSTGDVYAWIGLRRNSNSTDAAGLLTVVANVGHCLDASCNTAENFEKTMGTVKVGAKTTVSVEWDKANQKFVFKRAIGRTPMTEEIAYAEVPFLGVGIPDDLPAVAVSNRVDVITFVPNDADGVRPMGFMDAYFDDFYYK
ncbi:MAG: hypothetical protein AB9873_16490 [Syntrophobacteraceae bacterium]